MNLEKFKDNVLPEEHKERYSEDFIARVKAELPDLEGLHEALDSGNEWAGRFLDEERHFSMDVDKALSDGKLEKVIEAVKRADRINKLYHEWGESIPEITSEEEIEESIESVKENYKPQ